MAKTNYNQIRRQREAARKARQEAKLARRQAARAGETPAGVAESAEPAATPTTMTGGE